VSRAAAVPRVYSEARLVQEELLPALPHAQLLAGASFVASNCKSERDQFVLQLREAGLRVDALGKCAAAEASHYHHHHDLLYDHHQRSDDAAALLHNVSSLPPRSSNLHADLLSTRVALQKYMFNLAFENFGKRITLM
jgi:hypothetical protein